MHETSNTLSVWAPTCVPYLNTKHSNHTFGNIKHSRQKSLPFASIFFPQKKFNFFFLAKIMLDYNDANPINTKNKKGSKDNNKQLGTLNATNFFELHSNLFTTNTMDINDQA
jgi:hypothetical protein